MRPFPVRFRTPGLRIIATAWLVLAARPLPADPMAAMPVYGFAEQKIYGMTITATPGSTATLIADPLGFSVRMSTQAAADSSPTGMAHVGGIDALQSFIGSGVSAPVENYSGNAFPGMSQPANERVLLQWNATGAGVAGGFDTTAPAPTDFSAGRNFARSDGYVTPYPDTTIGDPGSGAVPVGWPVNGSGIAGAHLFAPIGTPGTLSIDLAAEALLDGESFARIASGVADWAVTGRFRIDGGSTARAAVSWDFNLVERLVVSSWLPDTDVATVANSMSFDVFDATGRSVFGPFLGANPSSTRMLSTQAFGSVTYNNNTMIPVHIYPGPVNMNFQTLPLAPGSYSFAIKGTTTASVTALPEPATWVSAAAAALCGCVVRWRRRRPGAPRRMGANEAPHGVPRRGDGGPAGG